MKIESKNIEIIVIAWEKIPLEYEDNLEFNKQTDYGLYQVYGNHYAYGLNSLLYIGKAEQTTFSTRLLNTKRLWGDFAETTVEAHTVRLGRLVKHNNQKGQKIDDESKWKNL